MKQKKKLIAVLTVLLLIGSVTGCAKIRNMFQQWKGSLIGLAFNISAYDDYGNKTLEIHGENVDVEVKQEEGPSEGTFSSEVLDFTIDGMQMLLIGNTMFRSGDVF